MASGARPAIFLDRDGTIVDEVGYLNDLGRLRVLPGAAEAVRRINDSGLLAIVVTNQSGVARRIFDMALLEEVHAELRRRLDREGARLDGIYVCPHHPEAADPAYRAVCDCRKPKPGMILRAAADHGVDLARSWMVGDSVADLEAAIHAGVPGVLVKTGYGRGELRFRVAHRRIVPAHVAEDLPGAVGWILERAAARAEG